MTNLSPIIPELEHVIPEILPSQAEHKLIDGSILLGNSHIGASTAPRSPLKTHENNNA